MIFPMKPTTLAVALCLLLGGCSAGGTGDVDVTPTGSGSSPVRLEPPAPERFEGEPTRIGFEPIELRGGEFPGMSDFAFLPDSDEFLAVTRTGLVGLFRIDGYAADMLGSFQIPAAAAGGECVSRIAVDPEFATNRMFYVGYCIDPQYSVVKRYSIQGDSFADTFYTASNVIASGDQRANAVQHAIGAIGFDDDGVMWANMGDRKKPDSARDPTSELGKILRFVPYKNPSANGFAPATSIPGAPRSAIVHAAGFADPRAGAFDSLGRYWVADAGGTTYQEIDVVTEVGQDFGWPASDGRTCKDGDCTAFEAPVRSWDASPSHPFMLEDTLAKADVTGRAAWVGPEYAPGKNDRYKGFLTGKVVYGDSRVGFVRGMDVDAAGGIVDDRHLGHLEGVVAWRQGRDGYVYAATMDTSGGTGKHAPPSFWRAVPLP